MNEAAVTYVGTLVPVPCNQCGLTFGLPRDFDAALRGSHRDFRCPNGHALSYRQESAEERERRLRQLAEAEAQWQRERAERKAREAVSLGHQLRSTKGVVTRIKRRVAHGVCPCCHRTFGDLARHMGTKHPGYAEASR